MERFNGWPESFEFVGIEKLRLLGEPKPTSRLSDRARRMRAVRKAGRLALRKFLVFALKRFPYCQWCGRAVYRSSSVPTHNSHTATVDHLTPISKGGSVTAWDNLAVACFPCNNLRGDRVDDTPTHGPDDWACVRAGRYDPIDPMWQRLFQAVCKATGANE